MFVPGSGLLGMAGAKEGTMKKKEGVGYSGQRRGEGEEKYSVMRDTAGLPAVGYRGKLSRVPGVSKAISMEGIIELRRWTTPG